MIIRNLPFLWRVSDQPNAPRPAGVPDRLDFEWDWDNNLGLLKQRMTPTLRTALDEIYAVGVDNLGAGPGYRRVFGDFIMQSCNRHYANQLMRPQRILEIGPGNGWLAAELTARGNNVTTSKNFPQDCDDGDFQMIVHHHVLEHVEDPLAFMVGCRERLRDDGLLIFAVPDCTESFELGDISMATSQHLNYFTYQSMHRLLTAAELGGTMPVRRGNGSLVVCAQHGEMLFSGDREFETFGGFVSKAVINVEKVHSITLEGARGIGVGMAVPMRGLAYRPDWSLYIFDDGMAGKHLDGVDQVICPLTEAPLVGTMLVFSLTHEAAIRARIGDRCKVITLREMLNA